MSLHDATDGELGDYLRQMSPEQLNGIAINVKDIFQEMLVMQAENVDGDAIWAQIREATNHPGSGSEFMLDGNVVRKVQLKAVQDPAPIVEHFSRYFDLDVLAASEVYHALGGAFAGRVSDSGVSNEAISKLSHDTLAQLVGEDVGDLVQDGVMTSSL